MHIELACQLRKCPVAAHCGKSHLRLELCRVVTAGSSAHLSLLSPRALSCPQSGSDSTYPPVQISGATSIKPTTRFNKNTGGKAQFTIFTENPEALAKIRQNKEAFDTVFIDGLWANTHWNAGTIVPIPFKDWDIYDDYFPEFANL